MVDIGVLTGLIGNRSVVVDACVSKDIADTLRDGGLTVRHVCDINPSLADDEIARLMTKDDVLITRDYKFYCTLGTARAIYIPSESGRRKPKAKPAKRKLPYDVIIAIKETVERERQSGILQIKILLGVLFVFHRDDYNPSTCMSLDMVRQRIRQRQ